MTKSTSFDSAIPPTPVLDNKLHHEKRQVAKNEGKRKPTQGICGPLAADSDEFQVITLPRHCFLTI